MVSIYFYLDLRCISLCVKHVTVLDAWNSGTGQQRRLKPLLHTFHSRCLMTNQIRERNWEELERGGGQGCSNPKERDFYALGPAGGWGGGSRAKSKKKSKFIMKGLLNNHWYMPWKGIWLEKITWRFFIIPKHPPLVAFDVGLPQF